MGERPDLFSSVGYTGREVQSKPQVYLRGENWPADTTLRVKTFSCYLKTWERRDQSEIWKKEASDRMLGSTALIDEETEVAKKKKSKMIK